MIKVIVTGGRDYSDAYAVNEALSLIKPDLVIQGGASGADTLAKEWAKANSVKCLTYFADWNKYGRGAGPIRNGHMLAMHPDAIVLVFPGGRGTANCAAQAIKRNHRVVTVKVD